MAKRLIQPIDDPCISIVTNTGAEERLSLIEGRKKSVHGIRSAPVWMLYRHLLSLEGTEWTPEEAFAFRHKTLEKGVGAGEVSRRMRERLSLNFLGTANKFDLELNQKSVEIKQVFKLKSNGTYEEGKLRLGEYARDMWMKFRDNVWSMLLNMPLNNMPDDNYKFLIADKIQQHRTSLNKSDIEELPYDIKDMLFTQLMPSILLHVDIMSLVCEEGFMDVPSADYDDAFELACVSQALPKLGLRRDYLVKRVEQQLALKTAREEAMQASAEMRNKIRTIESLTAEDWSTRIA